MATIPSKPTKVGDGLAGGPAAAWPREFGAPAGAPSVVGQGSVMPLREPHPTRQDALQGLLAFSALHQQIRRRRALAVGLNGFDTVAQATEFEATEQFVLDQVLQLVAERAIAITGADGLGIALAENNEIVLRASAGTIKPDVGARIQRDSAFSGACFRSAQVIRCDDTEKDDRVNRVACRQLGTRSMIAVPLCGRRRVIGLLEAFSAEPFAFNDADVGSLELLAELIVGALSPQDEDRFAESAQRAEAKLGAPALASSAAPAVDHAVATSAENSDQQPSLTDWFKTGAASAEVDANVTELLRQPSSSRHPGIAVALVLIVVFVLVAAGLWWKLNNAQLDAGLLQLQPPVAKPAEVAPPAIKPPESATAAADAGAASSSGPSANLNAGADTDSSADAGSSSQNRAKLPRISGVRHWSAADSSTVVLDLEDQVQYEAHRLKSPDRIYFDLHDTSLSAELAGKTIEIGDALLARIRVAQPVPGLTRVVLETRGNSNYSVSLEPNPYRLLVQVSKPGSDANAKVSLFPAAPPKLAILVPPPTRDDLQLRAHVPKMRIVVDAGHGGWDLGTVGRHGLLEKDVVLEIAQRLAKLLESRLGAEVILTRNDDSYIPLDERAGIANQAQADLFVSVHANYSDLPSARGVETYYTNFFSSPNTQDLEPREPNRAASQNVAAATLSPADLHEKIEQSRRLAASVQRSLYANLSGLNPGLRDRGVKEASYVVLTETAMPGILAEVSFVSSPTDEQKLRSDGYREQIAEALYKGIARYAASSHGVKVASAAK